MTLVKYPSKIVLVTGARKGIGLALAKHFLGEGATVLGLSRQPFDIDHANYFHSRFDVRDAKELRATFQQIAKKSTLNILINNAAVLDSKYALMLTATSAEAIVTTNLLGPFFVRGFPSWYSWKRVTTRCCGPASPEPRNPLPASNQEYLSRNPLSSYYAKRQR
jgi:NAD(P)-dependent dehydrogenase (short-subunit alcohol dehydrogenase family)